MTLYRFYRAAAMLLVATIATSATARAAGEGLASRGPIAPYLMSDPAAEIALARTAAPAAISAHASVLVFTAHGFETAVTGTNGFVCVVERSWATKFDDTEFWNPKERGPDCYNPAAARTEIPQLIAEAKWAAAGLSIAQMAQNTKAAFDDGTFKRPEPGAFGLMLSDKGYLNHAKGPWQPHMMFFIARNQAANWAADVDHSPAISFDRGPYLSTLVMVPVPAWSDGSAAPR